ncbi:hypothetical protein P3T22_006700 [Paraburkholderia sp. GAS348]
MATFPNGFDVVRGKRPVDYNMKLICRGDRKSLFEN